MRIKLSVLAVLAALAMPNMALAQSQSGCYVNANFEPSSWNRIDGADVNFGEIHAVNETATPTSVGTNTASSVTAQPLTVKMTPNFFFAADGGCISGGGLGLSVGGFNTKTGGSLSGTVNPVASTNFNDNPTGIKTWGNFISNPLQKFDPYGRAPISYDTSAEMQLQRFYVDGDYNFVRGNQALAGISFGLDVARLKFGASQEVATEGFLPDHYTANGLLDALDFVSQSQVQGTLLGPKVGFHFTGVLGDPTGFGISLNLQFSHSWLKGSVDETGNWTNHEVIEVGLASGGNLNRGPVVATNDESSPLSRSNHQSVQATDLDASARVRLFGGCLEVGPGITISRFDNFPMPASWSLPIGTSLANSLWTDQTTTLTLNGISISIGGRFSF